MQRSCFLPLVLFALLGLLAGCQSAETKPFTLTEANDGNPCRVRKGETIQVVLEGNPTTGYTWQVSDIDIAVVAPRGPAQFAPASDAVGASGKFTLTFDALVRGQTNLRLVYLRPFEKGVPPIKQFTTMITVY